MTDQSVFAFLGEDLLNSQLSDFATLIRSHFPNNVNSNQALSHKLDRFQSRQQTWPKEVISCFKNRAPPIYTIEDIVQINNAHVIDIENINTIRKSGIDALSIQIKTLQHRQNKKNERFGDNMFRIRKKKKI